MREKLSRVRGGTWEIEAALKYLDRGVGNIKRDRGGMNKLEEEQKLR